MHGSSTVSAIPLFKWLPEEEKKRAQNGGVGGENDPKGFTGTAKWPLVDAKKKERGGGE